MTRVADRSRMDCAAAESAQPLERLWERAPRLYLDEDSWNAAGILSELPVELVEAGEEADLLWLRRRAADWYDQLAPLQAINHIPAERAMVRKGGLAANLKRYGAAHPDAGYSHAQFFQPTYCLSDPAEAAAFMEQQPAVDDRENVWILKPSDLSRGIGVKIVWQFDGMRKELRKHGELSFRYEGKTLEYVIQRYIKDVLLLDGRKSELRIYWLVACLDPLLVLMYPEGTARMSAQPYKLGDFSNPLIHLTNTYQQKKHGGQIADTELKWDFARLEDYLEKEKGAAPDFLASVLRPKLRQSLAYVVRACLEELKDTPANGFFFGFYGADFILDSALTPWLTEIQEGPGLSHDDEVKARVLPNMLRGAASIVLEILALKRRGRPLAELSSTRGFEWVIGGP